MFLIGKLVQKKKVSFYNKKSFQNRHKVVTIQYHISVNLNLFGYNNVNF